MTIKLTREEAIQDLKAIKSFERYARGRLALDVAIEALEATKGWTPCSERLPSEKKAVLICDSGGNRFVGKLVLTDYGYKWSAPLFRVWIDIEDGDAWMPLPKPHGERREE